MGTLRLRQGDVVTSVAFTPDAKAVLAASGRVSTADSTIRMWDIATGKGLRRFVGHKNGVQGFAISPDGKVLASVSQDETARLWDLKTGKELRQLATGGEPSCGGVAFSPDGKVLATSDTTLKLWDPGTGQLLHQFEAPVWIFCLAFSPDGRTLTSAGSEKAEGSYVISLWDVTGRKLIRRIKGHTRRVYSLAFSPDGTTLASGGSDGTLRQWNVSTGEELRVLMTDGDTRTGPCCAFSPDGKTIAAAGDRKHMIRLFTADTGKELKSFGAHFGTCSIAFSPDGKTLTTGGEDSAVRLWDVATGKERLAALGDQTAVGALALSPDATVLAVQGRAGDVNCYDAPTGKLIRRLERNEGWVKVLGFAPDGKALLYLESGDRVMSWDVASGEKRNCLNLRKEQRYPAALSPDLKTAVYDEPQRLLDLTTGKESRLVGEWGTFAFSQDGRTLAAVNGEGHICLWRAAVGKELRRMRGSQRAPECLAFSPDGRWLATGADDRGDYVGVQLWSVATGEEMHQFHGDRGRLGTVLFSPDSRTLATTGHDPTVLLWEVATGQQRGTLMGHQGPVQALAFSSDGRRLASGSKDTTALIWDLAAAAGRPRPSELSPEQLRRCWDDLASGDPARAYRAIWDLAGSPKAAVKLLGERLRPIPATNTKQVAKLIGDLDSESFDVRQQAHADLEELGDLAAAELQKEAAAPRSAETGRQAKELLDKIKADRRNPSGRRLQALRAVEALEAVATPDARDLLRRLAGGPAGAWLTQEGKESLERLDKRPAVMTGK
jgi:WD40 repeat protein